jgi:hypothetical protein
MKRVGLQEVCCSCVVVLLAVIAGCQEEQTVGIRSPTPRAIGKLGPEESFELIVETFRRGVEDVQIGFRMPREGGHSMMVGKNEVSHVLIRPAKEGEPYKGIIKVDSESRYSIKKSTEEDEESESEESSEEEEAPSRLNATGEPSGTEILDTELVGTTGGVGKTSRSKLPAGDSVVSRRPDQMKREYELLYQNGRWELVTKLDPETEQSIDNAFKHALQTQI